VHAAEDLVDEKFT
jgi:hypothetical protein